jgi:hypothetical protein
MGNVYRPVGHGTRLAAEYSEARSLLEEKRSAMARIAEIDRMLRELSKEEPDAVEAARCEIPFRRGHDRKKAEEKAVPTKAPIAMPLINRPDFTA